MSFYDKMKGIMEFSEQQIGDLPRGYQILGDILILKLKPSLMRRRKIIGKSILGMFPYIRTVCLIRDIGGDKRKPNVEVIAGAKDTRTIHREHGCQFALDISKVMWSQGNKAEKVRLASMVKPGEIVIDMFAGIGYFSIIAAKHGLKRLYAIDINPDSTELLRRNVLLNGLGSKVEVLQGDCRKFDKVLEGTADRIFMGYLFDTEKFLPHAIRMAKKNAFIHLHRNVRVGEISGLKKKIVSIGKENGATIKIINVNEVKSYAPKVVHVVFDLKLRKN